jgi:D-methionine transport system substrate-binding protein
VKAARFLTAAPLILAVLFAASCVKKKDANAETVLTVGATHVPHAELLNLVKDDLAAAGYDLRVIEFSDYIQPNVAVITGDIDANFFQHVPYLDSNGEWASKLNDAFAVHIEPFGLYSRKYKNIYELPDNATIAIPNDPSNGGRAFLLLQANGLIHLRESSGLRATIHSIIENPKHLHFREVEAAKLPRSLLEVDAAAINGNFALQAGFHPVEDSLIIEGADSPYVNVVVVRRGHEESPKILALKKALLSDKVRKHIYDTYDGAVIPVF